MIGEPALGVALAATLTGEGPPRRAEAQMALIGQLSGVTLVSIDEDALLLRLSTAEVTAAGELGTAPQHSAAPLCYRLLALGI